MKYRSAHLNLIRVSRLALGIGLAVPLVAMLPTAALAQEAQASFDIPAGDLGTALQRYSAATGVQLVYSSDLVAGKRSPGVSGAMSPQQALGRLLAGSGLTARVSGNTATLLEAGSAGDVTAAQGERLLGPVRVEGTLGSPFFGGAGQQAGMNGVNGSKDITATEGTGSFTSGALTIGSKAPQALKDVPQSISVLTSERIEQQNITNFAEALRQLPGISLVQGETSLDNTFYSRGFAITSIQVDGGAPLITNSRALANFGFSPQIDMSIYDHVELLRGASGTFNGYGDPGGTVNLVRKKPLDHPQFLFEAQAGSWSNYRLVADAASPLALDGKLRGRLVLTWQDKEFFYDTAQDNKSLIYGIAELDVTPTTLLTAGLNYTRQDSVPWRGGLPRYLTGGDLALPRSTSIVFPWNRWDFETTEFFGGLEQRFGEEWLLKLNVTHNRQQSTQKIGFNVAAVNETPPAGSFAGPRMSGGYLDYATKQFSAEAVLTGAFEIFGQRQEVTIGASRVTSDGGGQTNYGTLVTTSASNPYQPYPGGPVFCNAATPPCPVGSIRFGGPPIDVFNFNPNDPLYTEPRNPLANQRYKKNGQTQSVAYMNLRLTAFDRLHLLTGVRWSRYDYESAYSSLCTTIPTTGTPADDNCVGRKIGDPYLPVEVKYRDSDVSWPPAVTLTFDVTKNLNVYVGYTDIYQNQGDYRDGDLNPIDPITGSNWEGGAKWQGFGGKLNASVAAFSISQSGFPALDGDFDYDVSETDIENGIFSYFVASNGRRVPNGLIGTNIYCCYKSDPNLKYTSKGVDVEIAGEIFSGFQLSANYTYNKTRQVGSTLGGNDGLPYVSIQPKHNFKIWTSYDFGALGGSGWLSRLTVSGGVNGRSSGYYSGSVCKPDFIVTNPTTNATTCPGRTVNGEFVPGMTPFSFSAPSYVVASALIDYRVSETWSLAVNVENIFDKTYYQSVGAITSGGNWYGTPRSFTATLRGKW
ncbi:TonB-dependent siderophore receptor [Sphingopyxis fribergensis]